MNNRCIYFLFLLHIPCVFAYKSKIIPRENILSESNLLATISKKDAIHPPVTKNKVFKGKEISSDNVLAIPGNLVETNVPGTTSTSVTTTTRKSWFDRMKDALAGVIVGILMYLLAFPVVTMGEGSFVHREKVLKIVKNNFGDEIKEDTFDLEEQKGKKIWHETGDTRTKQTLIDKAFNVSKEEKLFLHRKVEMYQYYETSSTHTEQDNFGGGETTKKTYHIKEEWFESPKGNPEHFQDKRNPAFPTIGEEKLQTRYFFPDDLTIKQIKVSQSQKSKFKNLADRKPVDLQDIAIPANLMGYKVENGHVLGSAIVGMEPNMYNPAVGTIRVSWSVGKLGEYTLMCGKKGDTWAKYTCEDIGNYKVPWICCGFCPCISCFLSCFNEALKNQNDIDWLEKGEVSVDEMFDTAAQSNMLKRTVLRFVGFGMFWLGSYLMLKPIAIFVSVIGFLGTIVSYGIAALTFVIALISYLVTLAITWLAYRPCAAMFVIFLITAIVVLLTVPMNNIK